MDLLLTWLISATSLFLTSRIVQGFVVKDFGSAFIASAVVGLLNMTLKPLLFILTLPINILTLGLFTFVINAGLLKVAAHLLKGFDILGWGPAIIGAFVLALVNLVLYGILT
jgi:putative membrane protein